MKHTVAVVVLAVALTPASAPADAATIEDATRGARYLVTRQAMNGSFFGDGTPADVVAEALAVVAAAPVGDAPVRAALRYLRPIASRRSNERAAYAARITLGLIAAGENPRSFDGDHVAAIARRYDPVKGSYDQGIYANALAVLGLAAAGEPIPDRVLTMFKTNGCRDGGFGHQEGCLSGADSDTTAIVLMALVAARVQASDDVVSGARRWLRENQRADGGFGARPGDALNANSTGLAISAIAALGEEPSGRAWRVDDGGTPLTALRSLQLPSGGFRYVATEKSANDYATVQAVPALAMRWYPIQRWPTGGGGKEAAARVVQRDAARAPVRTSTPLRRSVDRRSIASRSDDGRATASIAPPAGARSERRASRAPAPLAGLLLAGSAGLLAWRIRWSGAR